MVGSVVNITITEKRKVQIGSAIFHSGLNKIIKAATITPKLVIISPNMWIIAALMFKFSDSCSFSFLSGFST
jgi:hypothetical protein